MATTETRERVMMDCRGSPSGCTVTIAGAPEEVLDIAAFHAVKTHGEKDTPEFREELRRRLEPDTSGQVFAKESSQDAGRPERRA